MGNMAVRESIPKEVRVRVSALEEGREQCSESGNSMDKSRKRTRHIGLAGQ